MIVVVGHLDIDPADRDRFVRLSQDAVRQARVTDGCLHFAVTAAPLDTGRVDVAERWRDRSALEAFRGNGPEGALDEAIHAFHVEEIVAPDVGGPQHRPSRASPAPRREHRAQRARPHHRRAP